MLIIIDFYSMNKRCIISFVREDDSSIFFELYLDEKTELSVNAIMQLRDFLDEYIEENTDGYDNDDEIECEGGLIQ